MNTGTYYLYEYKNDQKLRNTGFLKIARREHTCFLRLNARRLPITPQNIVKLAAFYIEGNTANAQYIADISCGNHALYAKLMTPESAFPNGYPLHRIDGFFLQLPNKVIVAAVSQNAAFDTRKIVFSDAEASKKDTAVSESQASTNNTVLSETEMPLNDSAASESQDSASNIVLSETEASTNNTVFPNREVAINDTVNDTAPPKTESSIRQTAISEAISAMDETQKNLPDTSAANTITKPEQSASVRKIQRSDLSCLPRRHWHIANNSFLLHGYYNYNHLLLVEEDGHHWLGVPGIYDPRESRAAELFGFSQFTDSYNQQLSLTEDECNSCGRFGYWCRYLK